MGVNLQKPAMVGGDSIQSVMPSEMTANHPSPLNGSWTYTQPTPSRALKLHDIVFIRVDESAQSISLGNATSRKNTSYQGSKTGFAWSVSKPSNPILNRMGTRPCKVLSPMSIADSTMRTSQTMTFNIAASISDIRPNGTLVLTAKRTIEDNDNKWIVTLTGVCRSLDIDPSNVIMSRNIEDLRIKKEEEGHVRDSYSRGWFTKFLARVKPF